MIFLENLWLLVWLLMVVLILRAFRSASSHDHEFESSGGNAKATFADFDRPGSWHECPHKILSGRHAA